MRGYRVNFLIKPGMGLIGESTTITRKSNPIRTGSINPGMGVYGRESEVVVVK